MDDFRPFFLKLIVHFFKPFRRDAWELCAMYVGGSMTRYKVVSFFFLNKNQTVRGFQVPEIDLFWKSNIFFKACLSFAKMENYFHRNSSYEPTDIVKRSLRGVVSDFYYLFWQVQFSYSFPKWFPDICNFVASGCKSGQILSITTNVWIVPGKIGNKILSSQFSKKLCKNKDFKNDWVASCMPLGTRHRVMLLECRNTFSTMRKLRFL